MEIVETYLRQEMPDLTLPSPTPMLQPTATPAP